MPARAPAIVRGEGGLLGTIVERETDPAEGLAATVDVLLDDGRRLLVPAEFLTLQSENTYRLALSGSDLDRYSRGSSEVVVPVVAESVEVGKRRVVTGKVRVRKTVETAERVVDEPVTREEVEVERVPVNRAIAEPVEPRQEGDTLIVPLLEEVLVVEKRLILREEIRITRRKVEGRSSRKVALRSERATVERVQGEGPAVGE